MSQDVYINLIYKKLQDTLSPAEEKQLQEWLEQSEENKTLQKTIATTWNLLEDFEPDFEVDTAADYAKVRSQMQKVVPLSSRRQWWSIAASIALLIGAAFLFRYFQNPILEMQSLQAQAGEIKELALPDGSKIWLNENSQLEYPVQFSRQERVVYLKGEAFFEVTKNPEKIFQIHTGEAIVSVLGTSFNVHAYPDVQNTTVAVQSGKVRFTSKKQKTPIVLTKGEAATLDHTNSQLEKAKSINTNAFAWKTKKLSFKNTPLPQVFTTIQKHFKVTVLNQNPKLNSCLFTMAEQEVDLDKIFQILKTLFHLHIEETEPNTFSISNGDCE